MRRKIFFTLFCITFYKKAAAFHNQKGCRKSETKLFIYSDSALYLPNLRGDFSENLMETDNVVSAQYTGQQVAVSLKQSKLKPLIRNRLWSTELSYVTADDVEVFIGNDYLTIMPNFQPKTDGDPRRRNVSKVHKNSRFKADSLL